MKLPKELTTVSPLSKILAAILFILLPFIGFFLGIRYQEMTDIAKSQQEENNASIARIPTPTINDTANWKTYTNTKYGYEFKYPDSDYGTKIESELEYGKRYNVNLPESYIKSKKYSPPKLLDGIRVESIQSYQGRYGTFNTIPFTVFVVNNPENLTSDLWYQKYQFYPFEWDQPTESLKEITIENIVAKTPIYVPDIYPPQLFYIYENERIILIKASEEAQSKNIGAQILSTFKFTDQ